DIPKLIEPEVWERAQEIIAERSTLRRKARLKNEHRQRFLANGLLRCSCGKSIYVRYGSPGHGADSYFCSTRYPKGPGCGSPAIYREHVDSGIVKLLSVRLLGLIGSILSAVYQEQPRHDPARAKREALLAKLLARRKNVIDMRAEGDIDKNDYKQ